MKITKISLIILCCIMIITLPGCGFIKGVNGRLERLDAETHDEKISNTKITKEVLRCFTNKDKEGLKSLLCQKTKALSDIDEQILAAFDFFKGKVVSFDKDVSGYEGGATEDGERKVLDRAWEIRDIKTNKKVNYEIYINQNVIYKADKDRVGITELEITNSKQKKLIIGYTWPDYYSEGSDISLDVINALSDKDMAGLKALFCPKTQKINNFDEQIRNALTFFVGKATMGKVGTRDGNDLYDGDYDYTTSVLEKEIVKKSKPISTHISVVNKRIATDKGKNYEIEYYAYLLYKGHESYQGISQMKIIDDSGKELIIGERLS